MNSDKQQPVVLSLCRSLFNQFHWRCFALTMLITGCLVAVTWCKLITITSSSSSVQLGRGLSVEGSPPSGTNPSGGSESNGLPFDGPRRTGISGGLSGSPPLPMSPSSSSMMLTQSVMMSSSMMLTQSVMMSLSSSSMMLAQSAMMSSGNRSMIGACDDGYIYIPAAFVMMLYVVYLIECWHHRLRSELDERSDPVSVYDLIRRSTDAAPVVWWRAVCYHYVRRTRQVARYRNGDAFTATQVYYERVNSHVGRAAYDYSLVGVRDVSRRLVDLEKCPCTRVRLTKRFSFATPEAERGYEQQRAAFFGDHERRDDYFETREGVDLDGIDDYRDRLIVFADPSRPPWYLSTVIYWFSSIFLLSWPLRILVQYRTAHVHYYIHKVFGVSGTTSGNTVMTSSVAVQRTPRPADTDGVFLTSADHVIDCGADDYYEYEAAMESTIRTNTALVPTYSEAMSMDRVGRDQPPELVPTRWSRHWNGGRHSLFNAGTASRSAFGVARRTVYGSIVYQDDGRACFRSEVVSNGSHRHVMASGDHQRVTTTQSPVNYSSAAPTEINAATATEQKQKRRRRSYHEAVNDPVGSRSTLSTLGRCRRRGERYRRRSDVGLSMASGRRQRPRSLDDDRLPAWSSLSAVEQLHRSNETGSADGTEQTRVLRETRSYGGERSLATTLEDNGDQVSANSSITELFVGGSNATPTPENPLVDDTGDQRRDDQTDSTPITDDANFNRLPNGSPTSAFQHIESFDGADSPFFPGFVGDDSPPPYEIALRMRVMRPVPVSEMTLPYRDYQPLDDSSSISTVSTYLSTEPGELTPRRRVLKHYGGGLPNSSPGVVAAFRAVSGVHRTTAAIQTRDGLAMQTFHIETSL